jgi:hypothetical protein
MFLQAAFRRVETAFEMPNEALRGATRSARRTKRTFCVLKDARCRETVEGDGHAAVATVSRPTDMEVRDLAGTVEAVAEDFDAGRRARAGGKVTEEAAAGGDLSVVRRSIHRSARR